MSTIITPSPQPAGPAREEYDKDWTQLGEWQSASDWLDSSIEDRVIKLEHALVSRKARRELLAEIRRGDREWLAAAPTFRARRIAAVTYAFLTRRGSAL